MLIATVLLAALLGQPAGVTPQVQGVISDSDPVAGADHYDAWPVELSGGHRVTISVTPHGTSAAFSLSVRDAASGRTLAGIDGAQLAFTAPVDGTYMVRVQSAGHGAYTLHIANAASGSGGHGFSGPSPSSAGPPARFIMCPGHQRCPH